MLDKESRRVLAAYGTWVADRQREGYDAFLMTFMFDHIRGSPITVRREMNAAVTRLYSQTLTRIVRKPNTLQGRAGLPLWIVVPDYPRSTGYKLSCADVTINSGLHGHAINLTPRHSRLRSRFDLHFKENSEMYVRPPLLRVHIELIRDNTEYVVDYAMKGLKRSDISGDDLLILPRSRVEPGHRSSMP